MTRFFVDGHELAWEARGDGRPVLFLHGIAADRRVLVESCEPAFADRPGFRRIYVDLPGHGESLGNVALASADGVLAALAAFVRSNVAPNGVAVVGYSYGAYLALGLARELESPAGLFLACPVVEPDFSLRTVPHRRVAVAEEGLAFSDDPREREAFLEVAVRQTKGVLESFQRVVHPANVGVDPAFRDAIRGRYQMSGLPAFALRGLTTPVSIVCGRDDHWVGYEDAVRLLRAAPHAELSVLADCGHLLPLEQPTLFRSRMGEWLGRLA